MNQRLSDYLKSTVDIAPLVVFRILFGLMMVISIVRFAVNGWIQELYLKPVFFFSYFGFEWLPPLGTPWIYLVFLLMLLGAVGVMIGAFYHLSAITFFVTFTYVELLDKTNYLNHYYFVSLVALMLIFLPAHKSFSVDARRSQECFIKVPRWTIDLIKVQLGIVYFFAGLAKLNSSWLWEAMPLRIWLPAQSHWPIVGDWFGEVWLAYAFSWGGAFFDLFIVFFLWYAKTRKVAYIMVLCFHLITWWMFPIGMFPFIMILSTWIFFSEDFHRRQLDRFQKWVPVNRSTHAARYISRPLGIAFFTVFLAVQLVLPWRYLLYPGNLFWTEEGYRFSWRVMLMEKSGFAIFHVYDQKRDRTVDVMPEDFLTPNQVKMMSTQPDMILQYAHFLEKHFVQKGIEDPVITVDAFVSLNGKGSARFLDPHVDLTKLSDSFAHKEWIVSN